MQGASAARNVAKAPSKLPGEAKAASDLTLDPPFCVSLPVLINPLPPPRLPAPESSTPPKVLGDMEQLVIIPLVRWSR